MIRLNEKEEKRFTELAEKIINHPDYQKMKELIAHGRITVYQHSMDVARFCFRCNSRMHLGIDEEELITGALLHDFYLYDWHNASIRVPLFKMHGYTHPSTACENARERFEINGRVRNVIKSHMWPLTLRSLPSNKAAWLVCMGDKIVATREVFER